MKKRDNDGCEEFKSTLSRRKFMGISAAAAAAVGLPKWFPTVTFANSTSYCTPQCSLIKFFGRGGWDGLSICIPYNDMDYYNVRPLTGTLAYEAPAMTMTPRTCLDLDGFFGWPQAMTDMHNHIWDSNPANNNLAIVNAVGYTTNHSYSHFTGQAQLELGQPNPPASLTTGWIGRHLTSRTLPTGCPDPVVRAHGFGVAPQRSLGGAPDTVASLDPDDYNLEGDALTLNDRLNSLKDMYLGAGTFANEAQNAVDTIAELALVDFANYTAGPSGNSYPTHSLGQTFKAIAAMIDCGIAVETFGVDYGSWDHHSDQDPHNLAGGKMYNKMRETSEALTAFYRDMLDKGHLDWVIFAMTEFGRTAPENANLGTVHAKGNCMFLVGPQVNGGIYGTWPGLNNLTGGGDDLPINTDIRTVASEMIDLCMGNAAELPNIFPGFTQTPYLGIF